MFHLDRRKSRSRAGRYSAFLAVLPSPWPVPGSIWLGKYADLTSLAIDRSTDLVLAPPVVTAPSINKPNKSAVPDEVDLIAERVGEMQAELMRLNALGERLLSRLWVSTPRSLISLRPRRAGLKLELCGTTPSKNLPANWFGGRVRPGPSAQTGSSGERDRGAGSRRAGISSGWPVRSGYISSRYGFRIHPVKRVRIFHEGIDLASPNGTPIFASADGVVTFSGRKGGYGRLVEIRHADGLVTRYGHNSSNLVREGDMIRQGQKIATVGSSGTATGPHVHFEVLKNGRPVNPMPYLGARPRQLMAKSSPRLPG